MWTPLNPEQAVSIGDKIRYTNPVLADFKKVYCVEKTETHYFIVAPEDVDTASRPRADRKVVRYFDIGAYLNLEVWI